MAATEAQPTLREYTDAWLAQRALHRSTRTGYRRLLAAYVLPTFGDSGLRDITPAAIQAWYDTTAPATPTVRVKAYSVLRSILRSALAEKLLETDPCRITTGAARVAKKAHALGRADVEAIAAAMPAAYQLVILLAARLALPFSELRELRRKDIDLTRRVICVRRAVARRTDGAYVATTPTSRLGIRDLAIPADLLPTIQAHLREHVHAWPDSLLFPAVDDRDTHLSVSALDWMFQHARKAAGHPDIGVRDLRRFAVVEPATVV